ncbi:MAG: FG-GAP repeat domain-containing protein [Geminicoccaceae bacterium]
MVNPVFRPSGWILAASAVFAAALQTRGTASPALLQSSTSPAPASSTQNQPVATEDEVKARCSICHKLPPPDILPRSAWRDEMGRMMLIQEGVPEPASATNFLPLSPDWLRLWRYYDAHAPEKLPEPEPWPAASNEPVPFEKRSVSGAEASGAIAIANVRLFDVDGDKRLDIIASEMRTGPVLIGLAKDGHALKSVARLSHPAHIEPVDLDKDGRMDFLVADLGSFQPADHSNGAVYWLRGRADGSYVTVPLATGLPRTADARAADFDGDGDLDIIVGSFGWRFTGNVTVLENKTTNWKTPVFTPKILDPRTGAIHVPIVDLNKDGKPDFVVLLAQQHEAVVAFINKGGKGLEFTQQVIYEAPHPNWGSSGIELVDLDQDGDMDVLLTHGDTFDDFVLKPYHGIMWLENTGTFPFVAHHLATLPGAQRAQAVDLDGDGDLDIVASAFVSGEQTPHLASLVWLEQTAPGVFVRHTLESGTPSHATLDIGDVDGDGKPDIVTGWFALGKPLGAWADIWRNERK